MNAFRSALHNPVAHASFGAGIILCLLVAFVVHALDNRVPDPDRTIEGTSVLSVSSAPDSFAEPLRDIPAGLATDRIGTLSSWQPVLRWAPSNAPAHTGIDHRQTLSGSGRLKPVTQLAAPPDNVDDGNILPTSESP